MPDITIAWDVANSRGDWVYQPFSIAGQQVNVPSPTGFGTGDGATTAFTLTPTAGAIASIISAQMYRNDWQGNQLLSATPRTNNAASINNFSSYLGTTITPNSGPAPDGSNNASLITFGAGAGGNLYYLLNNAVGPQAYSIYAKAGTVGAQFQLTNDKLSPPAVATFNLFTGSIVGTSGGAGAAMQSMGNGWYRCSMLFSEPSGMASDSIAVLPLDRPGTLSLFGMQAEQGTAASPYIPTTTGPATVTDYTLSAVGAVSLAAAPAGGAVLSWAGAYITNVATPGGLLTGNDLETAVLISLFTNRIANPDDFIPDGTGDPRGWWGDYGEDKPIGSRLWLLDRSKQTQEVLNNARDYIIEALQWLVDDGVVAGMDVQTEWTRTSFLGAQITLYQPTGPQIPLTYAWAWNQLS